ncbi:TPA: hypothetical protein U2M54_001103 [Providencia rettgeri]|uniref:hypothetical protein n=1 Tax=Providencia TaxID=586 RepID=UPI001B392407|nr:MULTISPECIES: hypothetical protein [Providencia]EMC8779594.1 hypothetical protein [Providencia rettgeri]MBQ0530456.1 hypothetical protein [Providencia rettgeri]MCL0009103.1 hypothetical protein [Providencia rettgeri]WOB85016.1 hypothetical protein P3L40_15315 [Providencia sp. PROV040]HEM8339026.1 hypothetical protein [Providencia rettgeri]
MATLLERHNMIIRMMNDREKLMQPISDEVFQELVDKLGMDQLANDVRYLVNIGLINYDAIRFGIDGGYGFNTGSMSLTAAGVDYANMDTIGNQINTVTIKIHQNTIDNLEAMIRSANIPDEDKKSLLSLVKEKGSEAVVGKLVDTVFANAGIAAALFMEAAKSKLGL